MSKSSKAELATSPQRIVDLMVNFPATTWRLLRGVEAVGDLAGLLGGGVVGHGEAGAEGGLYAAAAGGRAGGHGAGAAAVGGRGDTPLAVNAHSHGDGA